jgi:hypothetical protein
MNASAKRPFSRDQRTTIVHGILVFVLIVDPSARLLTATMNAWLGDDSVVWPAAASTPRFGVERRTVDVPGPHERTRRIGEQ